MKDNREVTIAVVVGLASVFAANLLWYGIRYSLAAGLIRAVVITALTSVVEYLYWRWLSRTRR